MATSNSSFVGSPKKKTTSTTSTSSTTSNSSFVGSPVKKTTSTSPTLTTGPQTAAAKKALEKYNAKQAAAPQQTSAPAQSTSTPTQNTQPAPAQPTTTAPATQTGTTAAEITKERWDAKTVDAQKMFLKLHPSFDISKYGWEMAKSNAPAKQTQNTVGMIQKTPQVEQQPQQEELDYQTNDPNRMAQISSNLDLAYQQTPTLFKDRATFEENFDYEERSDAQQLLLDDFFNRKEKENMLKVTPVEEMVRAIASGKTSIGAYDGLETLDPVKYQALLDGIEKSKQKTVQDSNLAVADATYDGGELKLPDQFVENNKNIDDAIASLDEAYNEAVNNPDLLAKKDELTAVTNEITQMDSDIMRVANEVKEQYPGVPRSQLNAIIADRTDKYRISRGDALIKANTLQGLIQNRMEDAKSAYEMQSNKIGLLMSANNAKMQQLGFAFDIFKYNNEPTRAKEMAQYQADLSLETAQKAMEQEYEFNNPQRDSEDPAEQERALSMSMDRFYEDFGSIINRSKGEVVADVKRYAQEKGISLSQAMQENFVSQLKAKPQYQQILNTKLGISNEPKDPTKGIDFGVIGQNEDGTPIMGFINSNNQTITPVSSNSPKASGKLVPIVANGQQTNKKVDEVAAQPLNSALAELHSMGVYTLVGSGARTHEEQAKLYAAYQNGTGGIAAAPGTSKHESGMGLDIYSDDKFSAPTQTQINVLAKYGWEHQAIQGDMGHFEYKGNGQPTGLSSAAQAALNSKSITGTPTIKAAIATELQDAGVFDKGEGNKTFYEANGNVKGELDTFAQGKAKWDEAYALYKKLGTDISGYTGWGDEKLFKGQVIAGGGNEDAIKLNKILGQELSTYMMKISGATVPDAEVERLSRQVPNFGMGDTEFITNMETYNKSMQRSGDFMLNNYGFDSFDTMKKVIYGKDGNVVGTSYSPSYLDQWVKPSTQTTPNYSPGENNIYSTAP